MRWPTSKSKQATIALITAAICAVINVVTKLVGDPFNAYYHHPQRPPYFPYANAYSYNLALSLRCLLVFLTIFVIMFGAQRLLTKRAR
jgi:hypothetical protein